MSLRSKINLIIFQTLVFSLMFALFGRLFYLQVLESDKYQDAAISIQSRDVVTPAVRGAITDINGTPMVVDLPGLVVSINRIELDKQADKGVKVLAQVANLFNLEYSDIYQRTRLCGELPRDNRAGCWNGTRYQPIPLVGNASQDLALKIMENADLYPGVEVQSVPIRSYPSLEGENVAHVLGYVGSVTDEDLKNPEINYYRNEVVGKTGLETKYNQYLRGTPGVRTFLVNRKEVVTKQNKNISAIAGNNLITNIDARLQAGVERSLEAAVKRARASGYRGDSGAAIVLEIKTGRVLAMASFYAGIPVGHVEAGLRTDDLRSPFPEEMNRRVTSTLTRWHFCPTEGAKANLVREGIPVANCHVTGNTVIDALLATRAKIGGLEAAAVGARLGIAPTFVASHPRQGVSGLTGAHELDPIPFLHRSTEQDPLDVRRPPRPLLGTGRHPPRNRGRRRTRPQLVRLEHPCRR